MIASLKQKEEMSIYHCYCNAYNWCRPIHRESFEETLWIRLNQRAPAVLVPGTEALYCYWKIGMYLEIPKRRVDLYVPPEWRSIKREILDNWIGQLRNRPYEDIILGETNYQWLPHALVPAGQRTSDIPIPGQNGWPSSTEEVPYWDTPRFQYSDGTNLPIRLNREIPKELVNGMEKIFCYWKITMPGMGTSKLEIWVPPEWRGLTSKALANWCDILRSKPFRDITLGGVEYEWNGDTILPKGQKVEYIESQGYGVFNYRPTDDSDEEEDPAIGSFERTREDNQPLDIVLETEQLEEIIWENCPSKHRTEAPDPEEIVDEILSDVYKELGIHQEKDKIQEKLRKPKPTSFGTIE